MRLSRNGLAAFASLDAYQGAPNGSVVTLRPGQAREAGWLTDDHMAINCPLDPAHLDGPWHTVSLDGRELLAGSWPYMRCGGGVVAGSGNSFGQIRWPSGELQDFTGRLVGISADGVVILTNQDHTSLDFWHDGQRFWSLDPGGILQQSNAQESDQLDCQWLNDWLTWRTQHGTTLFQYRGNTVTSVGGYVPNPYARTTIPLDNGTLVEWDGKRTTWRPHDSRNGLILRDEPSDFFYLDAVDVDGDLILIGSLGAGQLATDFKAYEFKDYESLPRVDVITRPTPSGYDYTIRSAFTSA